MDISEILSNLEVYPSKFPKETLHEAIQNKDEVIPGLIDFLHFAIANVGNETVIKEFWGHIYALYLLAQFRHKPAYPVVMELLSLPGNDLRSLFGDYDGLESVMASVSCGDTSLIKELVENSNANEYIRSFALDALMTLYVVGEMSREDLIAYFKELFDGKLEKNPAPVWDGLADCCLKVHAKELCPEVIKALDDDLIWAGFVTKEEIQSSFEIDQQVTLEKLYKDGGFKLIEDVIQEMEWWACFNENDPSSKGFADNLLANIPQWFPQKGESEADSTKPEEKIGRNQPCPCGSGKKYKKCCGKPGI